MHVEDRHGVNELRGLTRKARDGRVRTRLQVLVPTESGVRRLCRRVMAIDDPSYFRSSCGRSARGQPSQFALVRQ